MVKSSKILRNPLSGETFTILKTSTDTYGCFKQSYLPFQSPGETWVLGFQLGFAMGALVFGSPLLELILVGGTIGLVTGLITGIAFIYMFPDRATHEHSDNTKIADGHV